jgi:hypothetical protein
VLQHPQPACVTAVVPASAMIMSKTKARAETATGTHCGKGGCSAGGSDCGIGTGAAVHPLSEESTERKKNCQAHREADARPRMQMSTSRQQTSVTKSSGSTTVGDSPAVSDCAVEGKLEQSLALNGARGSSELRAPQLGPQRRPIRRVRPLGACPEGAWSRRASRLAGLASKTTDGYPKLSDAVLIEL